VKVLPAVKFSNERVWRQAPVPPHQPRDWPCLHQQRNVVCCCLCAVGGDGSVSRATLFRRGADGLGIVAHEATQLQTASHRRRSVVPSLTHRCSDYQIFVLCWMLLSYFFCLFFSLH